MFRVLAAQQSAGCQLVLALVALAAGLPGQESRAELVQRLGSDQHGVRNDAYRKLARDRSPKVVSLLAKEMEGYPHPARVLAGNLLRSRAPEECRSLYQRLVTSESPFLRVLGASGLLRSEASARSKRRQRHRAVVAQSLVACSRAERVAALHASADVRHPQVVDAVRGMLAEATSGHEVRSLLRDLMRRERELTDPTRAAIEPLTKSEDGRTAVLAAAYLSRVDPAVTATLAAILKKTPALFWEVRDLLVVGGRPSEQVLGLMVAALGAPRSVADIRRTAELLRGHSRDRLAPALRGLLVHDKEEYRETALAELMKLPGGLSEKELQSMLQSEWAAARVAAADGLRQRDDRSGLAVLLALLPKAKKHRAEAVRALGKFRDRAAVPPLLDMLDDPDGAVRASAWQALQQTWQSLFPYRRFDFDRHGFKPQGANRSAAVASLRAWWESVS